MFSKPFTRRIFAIFSTLLLCSCSNVLDCCQTFSKEYKDYSEWLDFSKEIEANRNEKYVLPMNDVLDMTYVVHYTPDPKDKKKDLFECNLYDFGVYVDINTDDGRVVLLADDASSYTNGEPSYLFAYNEETMIYSLLLDGHAVLKAESTSLRYVTFFQKYGEVIFSSFVNGLKAMGL